MERERALQAAGEVAAWLDGACTRVQIAGSLRRGRAEVKDIEIVAISAQELYQATLFGEETRPAVDGRLAELVALGRLRWDDAIRRNGPRYKRLVHAGTGLVVDLFLAEEDNWGVILALRTGPAEFSRGLVSHSWAGGVMPAEMKLQDGRLWRRGVRLATPTEESFFAALGLAYLEPEARTLQRLLAAVEG